MAVSVNAALKNLKTYAFDDISQAVKIEHDNTGYSWNAQWDGQVGETHTPEDTINQYKRDFANAFVNGVGYW